MRPNDARAATRSGIDDAGRIGRAGYEKENAMKCPTCNSTAPHMHPAMQHEGEVELCVDDFHLMPTNQNTPNYIAAVLAKRENRK